MLTLRVESEGLERKFDTLAEQASDIEKPLKVFGFYLRKRALARYAAQAFAPLADSTLENRARRGLASMEAKLHADVRRAKRKQSVKGMANRMAVLREFQRRHGSGDVLMNAAFGKALTLKQAASLTARTSRQVARTVGRPILGGLPRTLVVEVGSGSVTLTSKTHQEWSDAHNKGATVGHGAHLPKRETVKLEEVDLDVLASILKQHLLLPFAEGAQGPGF